MTELNAALLAEALRLNAGCDDCDCVRTPQLVRVPTEDELMNAPLWRLAVGNFPTNSVFDEHGADGKPSSQLDLRSETTNATLQALRAALAAREDGTAAVYDICINRMPTKPVTSGNHDDPPKALFLAFEKVVAPYVRRIVEAGATSVFAIAPSAGKFVERCLKDGGYTFETLSSYGRAKLVRGSRPGSQSTCHIACSSDHIGHLGDPMCSKEWREKAAASLARVLAPLACGTGNTEKAARMLIFNALKAHIATVPFTGASSWSGAQIGHYIRTVQRTRYHMAYGLARGEVKFNAYYAELCSRGGKKLWEGHTTADDPDCECRACAAGMCGPHAEDCGCPRCVHSLRSRQHRQCVGEALLR